MKAVIQRVSQASVSVDGVVVSSIQNGFVTLLGIGVGDTENQCQRLLEKIVTLRVFPDSDGKMNLSLKDVGAAHLIISQFTLLADTSKGKRPGFANAEKPERAKQLYEHALGCSRNLGIPTYGGIFQADMKVALINDGPVTFVLET